MTDTRSMTSTDSATAPVVTTEAGQVQGFAQDATSSAYLGIPFAEAPVGPLRYSAPVRRAAWDGVRPATAYGATAQREPFGPFVTIPEPSVPGLDTLGVNVFTPAAGDTEANLPVFVWIHGGGYFAGSPASPWYNGRRFNRDGVVTVTVSYRLGFQGFGYVPAPGEGRRNSATTGFTTSSGAHEYTSGFNRGLLDQLAALEWVQENIRAFGGDPDKVTIGGQSAGGGSVLALMASGRGQGLFRSVIAHSGAAGDVYADDARAVATAYAASLGIEPTFDGWSAVPEERITATERAFNTLGGGALDEGAPPRGAADLVRGLAEGTLSGRTGIAFAPVIDGELIPTAFDPALAANAGFPLLLGTTRNEFSAPDGRIVLADAVADLRSVGVAEPAIAQFEAEVHRVGDDRAESQLTTSSLFRTAVPRVARVRLVDGGTPTWTYDFAGRRFDADPSGHCSDLPFAWDLLDAEQAPLIVGENASQTLADRMHADWVQFVSEGTVPWDAVTADRVPTRSYVNEGHVDADDVYGFELGLFEAAEALKG